MGETTIVFVGESKVYLYKCTMEISELWDVFRSKIAKAENGDRIIDDNQWKEFYASLTPQHQGLITLLNEVPLTHDNIS